MNIISTIPALTAMFFCFSQGRDSLEHLNGVEYKDYIVFNQMLLDSSGQCVASFNISDFSLDEFEAELSMHCKRSQMNQNEKKALIEVDEPSFRVLPWNDPWYYCHIIKGSDGYVHIQMPCETKQTEERFKFIIPSVYYRGARMQYLMLGGVPVTRGRFQPAEDSVLPSNADCMGFAKLLLHVYHGDNVSLTYNFTEMERRTELLKDLRKKELWKNQNWLDRKWQWSGYYGNPSKTMKAMGVAPLVKPGRVPNVNYRAQGFKELRKQLETLIAKQSGAVVHLHKCVDNGEIVEWDFCLGDKSRVHVSMANAYSITQAMKMMYTYPERFFDDNFGGLSREIGLDHKYNCEQLPDMLEFAEGVAGEHTIRMRQLIGEDGLPVKGSEKRSIYFTRGNTAVGVFTDNPAFNVLPAARAIDKLLVEGMRKAGEPLTREQDYLKEKQK
ncbi:MAG: hypothetical protein Q4F30_10070 [Akkermansia sp.]|nr:hypothetical protein [Akkermansia sp.]